MSDQSRYPSSPPSASSGRPTPSIARPDWPWARNYSYRSRQGSPNPSIQGSNTQSGWDPRMSGSAASTQSGYSGSQLARATYIPKSQSSGSAGMAPPTGSTRQWTFTGFEWTVRDVHKLRDYVEGIHSPEVEPGGILRGEAGDFEILSQSPMLGDHKFKLEIVPVNPPEGSQTGTTLSLYITTLSLDFADDDFEIYASMMVAIKCQDDRIGERGARPDWIWEFWQNDWAFRRDNEVWACPLPPLSKLLEHSRIQTTDSFVICVQIHSPVGPSIPQHPSVYHVPRDLLDGLEASLDNPNTGDVRFVCLEKYAPNQNEISNMTASLSSMLSSPSGTPTSHPTARKRIIHAHSDILVRRSEYFAAMLTSSFAENSVVASNGERKLYTVIVEEADFETIYWLLKYCYANWLLFKQDDDPRDAVEGVGAGWSIRWLSGQHDEWDWKPFHPEGASEDGASDNKSATSGDSVRVGSSVSGSASNLKKPEAYQSPSTTSMASSALKVNSVKPPPNPRGAPPATPASASSSRAVGGASATSRAGGPSSSTSTGIATGIPRSQTISVPSTSSFPTLLPYPASPRTKRNSSVAVNSPDPHSHPTAPPSPASALSIYQVAHRYIMPSLAALALEHMLSTITPESSFALLLATAAWDELHSLVEDYVVDRWDEVCVAKGFEDCCKEVAAGEWGVDGGKTMMSVFRRLRSPAP